MQLSFSKNTSLSAYLTLKWSTLVVRHATNLDEHLPKLIEAQGYLSAAALASVDKKLNDKVYALLRCQWKHANVEGIDKKYADILSKQETSNGLVVIASLLTKYLVSINAINLVDTFKVRYAYRKIEVGNRLRRSNFFFSSVFAAVSKGTALEFFLYLISEFLKYFRISCVKCSCKSYPKIKALSIFTRNDRISLNYSILE